MLKDKAARQPVAQARQHSAVIAEDAKNMFTKILIANRGEIACRVIKTARKMGIATVAVYTPRPTRTPCSLNWPTKPSASARLPRKSPTWIADKIIAACKQTGAQAVHPGYGFLSENAEFSAAWKKKASSSSVRSTTPSPRWATRSSPKKLAIEAG